MNKGKFSVSRKFYWLPHKRVYRVPPVWVSVGNSAIEVHYVWLWFSYMYTEEEI